MQSDSPSTELAVGRRFGRLAFTTAGLTYALIVFGGVVRITGSGMGCGDDWPLCNGQLIPPMDAPTLIEYGHRLAAALVGFFVLGLAAYAVKHRKPLARTGPGALEWAMISAVLLVVQVLVGAITVRLELPTSTVVLHLIAASLLFASLLLAGLTATGSHEITPTGPASTRVRASQAAVRVARLATGAVALAFMVVAFGALVANTDAGPLCRGFPLCNGQIIPKGSGLMHLHWTHRLLAYTLVLYVPIAAALVVRTSTSSSVRAWALASAALVVLQLGVGALLVIEHLTPVLQGVHLAVGIASWGALVLWAATARLATGRTLTLARAPTRVDRQAAGARG